MTFSAAATGSLPITFEWDLGDGNTASGGTVSHVYALAGHYSLVMTATNPCSQEILTRTVEVTPSVRRIYLPLVIRSVWDARENSRGG